MMKTLMVEGLERATNWVFRRGEVVRREGPDGKGLAGMIGTEDRIKHAGIHW